MLEAADAALGGAGEGTFFVAKELAFEELRREGGAVDRDHFRGRAAGKVVDQVGDDFLAGAGLAFDEHGGPGGRNLLDKLGNFLDLERFADESVELVGLRDLLGELFVFRLEVAAAERALEQHLDLVEVERLGDEVPSAVAHGLDGGVDRAVGGHHQRERRVGQRERGVEHLHARVATKAQVGEQELDRLAFQNLGRLARVGGGVDVEFLLQRAAQALAGGAFVVDNQQGGQHGGNGVGKTSRLVEVDHRFG